MSEKGWRERERSWGIKSCLLFILGLSILRRNSPSSSSPPPPFSSFLPEVESSLGFLPCFHISRKEIKDPAWLESF